MKMFGYCRSSEAIYGWLGRPVVGTHPITADGSSRPNRTPTRTIVLLSATAPGTIVYPHVEFHGHTPKESGLDFGHRKAPQHARPAERTDPRER